MIIIDPINIISHHRYGITFAIIVIEEKIMLLDLVLFILFCLFDVDIIDNVVSLHRYLIFFVRMFLFICNYRICHTMMDKLFF